MARADKTAWIPVAGRDRGACALPALTRTLLLAVSVLGMSACAQRSDEPQVLVFGAASLTDALEAMADSFEVAHPSYHVVLSVAATSILARQIEQGAGADVFFSANAEWMRYLDERGLVDPPVRYPLGNRLVVAGPPGTAPHAAPEALLALDRIALADPDQVPAGIYARQALVCSGLWDRVAPHVVPTIDVRAALHAVQQGAADASIVYASDLRVAPSVRQWFAWPDTCRPDIRYALARLVRSPHPAAADTFVQFATAPARAAFWQRYGFVFHGE